MAITRRAFLFGGAVIAAATLVESSQAADLIGLSTTAPELDLFALEVGQGVTLTFPDAGLVAESFLVSRISDAPLSRVLEFTRVEPIEVEDGPLIAGRRRCCKVGLTVNR